METIRKSTVLFQGFFELISHFLNNSGKSVYKKYLSKFETNFELTFISILYHLKIKIKQEKLYFFHGLIGLSHD